jgi:hypothetical protein
VSEDPKEVSIFKEALAKHREFVMPSESNSSDEQWLGE